MSEQNQRYHCCATCQHFRAENLRKQQLSSPQEAGDSLAEKKSRVRTYCARLGYETRSFYQFRCWTPRPDIIARMKKNSAE
ncbi:MULTISPECIES: hypothetical protein [Alicyclobacillus]|uniref:Uncharacterized protein n=1 Tax=Alicyclobacillus tolerans TaxID=90970 RepID=A0ABT9LTX0_9BACL|nr:MULTISPECIES: hypothetical protein [Alicyclobacillus]MDP9727709.1 hypothetical protein [Alicyclobacillus tengchongensis]